MSEKAIKVAADAISLLVISGVIREEEVREVSRFGFDGILSLLKEKKFDYEFNKFASTFDFQLEE